MTTNLADQTYWESGYVGMEFSPPAQDDFIRTWINAHVPRGTGDCLEVGCFPGRYLSVFGDLGYRLNGIDLASRVDTHVPKWLADHGYAVGQFARADFLTFPFEPRFDVVSSFGFIEHFTDWYNVLARHADLVRPGGYLVIEAPNMAGLMQRFLRRLFDSADLSRHYTPSMDPQGWAEVTTRLGFEIVEAGPISNFSFWRSSPIEQGIKSELMVILDILQPILETREETRGHAAAGYQGLIAKRVAEGPPADDPSRIADLDAIGRAAVARDLDISQAAETMAERVEVWIKYMNNKWQSRL